MNSAPASGRQPPPLAALDHPRKAIRRGAALALASAARSDPRVRDELCAGLASARTRTRFACAVALAQAGASAAEPGLLDALCEAIGAPESDRRWAAAAALARLRDNSRARARLAQLVRGGAPRARRMALYGLRGLDGPHDCRICAAGAADADAHVRLAALALISARAPGCARCAACALKRLECDRAPGVRRAAAAALGRLGVRSPAIRRALTRAAQLPDNGLARAVRGALERLLRD
jgi:HEAT repeat protein